MSDRDAEFIARLVAGHAAKDHFVDRVVVTPINADLVIITRSGKEWWFKNEGRIDEAAD